MPPQVDLILDDSDGDGDLDGIVGVSDVLSFLDALSAPVTQNGNFWADLDCNGEINTADNIIFLGLYGNSCP